MGWRLKSRLWAFRHDVRLRGRLTRCARLDVLAGDAWPPGLRGASFSRQPERASFAGALS